MNRSLPCDFEIEKRSAKKRYRDESEDVVPVVRSSRRLIELDEEIKVTLSQAKDFTKKVVGKQIDSSMGSLWMAFKVRPRVDREISQISRLS